MRFDNRHVFSGKINGYSLRDFKDFDYKLLSLEERLKFVNEKIESTRDENGLSFFENYIDRHYKDKLNGSDELSENHDVFKALESAANYLLGSKEIRELRKNEEQQYKFYMDETEFRLRTQKEQLFENVASNNDMSTENVIHFLLTNHNKNHLLANNVSVTAKDIHEDSYCGSILKEYHTFLNHVDSQIKNPTDEYKGKRYILTKNKREILGDMVNCKIMLQKPIKFTHICKGTTVVDWNCFKWDNHAQIKELIYVTNKFHPESDLSFILLDLENLTNEMINKSKLTKSEIKIYKLIRKGCKNNEIAEMLQVGRTYISNTVAVIVKKISNYAVSKHWNEEV